MPNQTSFFTLALLAVLGLGCATIPVPLPDADRATLDELARAPEAMGELVYEGAVFPLDADGEHGPVFAYQRRVRDDGDLRVSTHLTRGPADGVLIALAATHTAEFGFVALEQTNAQSGVVGRVQMIDATHVAFERHRGDRVRSRVETVDAPVVAGPTLFGWVLAHWDAIASGPQRVRFAALDDARTYGFELRLDQESAETTVISFRATSPVVRAAVPSMRFVFDTATRKILRYEGRVPPMRARGRGLKPLDARVEYTYVSQAYR